MPLVGEDPFGDDFLTRYEEWKGRGMPYHGLPGGAKGPARRMIRYDVGEDSVARLVLDRPEARTP